MSSYIEYMLRQDTREKKSAARGARARVSGSKTKYCGLPSDNLTAAQLKRRNGPVLAYNVTKCLSYKEFKRLPDDLQRAYLSTISRVYRVPMLSIAEAMGCSHGTMSSILQRLELDPVRGRKRPAPGDKWFDFVAGRLTVDGVPAKYAQPSPAEADQPSPAEADQPTPEADAPERFETAEENTPPALVYPTSGTFSVTCTPAELDRYLRLSLPADAVCEFSVSYALISAEEARPEDRSVRSPLHRSDREA